ncbi:MAG: electron transfer flavoprotein subunit beta/FixA family protein [Chloroflexia bacterium]|nr:electron transfer flavoprotein subunit beta/FixA family protein [Chloroflexia bacterium]
MEATANPLLIAVLVKQVPDMNAVKIDRASGTPVPSGQRVVSSYDVYAIEEALRLRERHGGEVVALTAGPAAAKDGLTRALAMGADRAIHVEVADPNGLDTLAVARLLADQVRPLGVDLVLAGQASDDYESGQVGAQVAELLGLPLVSSVVAVEVTAAGLRLRRDMEDGYQSVRAPLPCLLLTSTGLNEPRFPSLKGILAAKKKPIERVSGEPETVGRATWSPPTVPASASTGVVLQDVPAAEAAKQLVSWLQEQKVI